MTFTRGSQKLIAVVLFPGVSALELVGTTSVLNGLGLTTGFRTVTVGPRREPVDADVPLELIPESTFDQVPHPFGIVVPGGGIRTITAMGDAALLEYLGAAARTAKVVSAVGTGSLLLAATSLLKGRRATTHWAYRRILETLGATYVEGRWVEDGPFVTSGGTSGGIDMALHLVAKYRNQRSARQVQLWVEYDPQPPFGALTACDRDVDALTPLLTPHRAEWQAALAQRPELLQAVEAAIKPPVHMPAVLAGRGQ